MHEELEARLRAARDDLDGPSPAAAGRALAGLRQRRLRRGQRVLALLRSRPLRAVGATAAVGALVAVISVLFVNSSSSVRPGTGQLVPVPDVKGKMLDEGYRLIREAGFTVTIPQWYTFASTCRIAVATQSPPPQAQAPTGSSVSLKPGGCPLESLFGESAEYVVEDFRGRTIADVTRWAEKRGLLWDARTLPPLSAAREPQLLDNYRVDRQEPEAGTPLRSGVASSTTTGGSFSPTPLVVHAKLDLTGPRLEMSELRLRLVGPGVSQRLHGDGSIMTLADVRGSVTVLAFTNAHCPTCAKEAFRVLARAGSTGEVTTAVVSVDRVDRRLATLARSRAATVAEVVNPRVGLAPFGGGFLSFPSTVLIDRSGRVALLLSGPTDADALDGLVRGLLAEPVPPIAGPVTPLPLSRVNGPPLALDQIPALMTPLSHQICPVDPGRVYLLTTSPDGKGHIYLGRTHGDGVIIQEQWALSMVGGSRGCGDADTRFYARELRRTGVVSVGLVAEKPHGKPDVIRRFAFVVADGYTEATVAGKAYLIDGNGFMLQGRFANGTVVTFRGPAGAQRRTLHVGPRSP